MLARMANPTQIPLIRAKTPIMIGVTAFTFILMLIFPSVGTNLFSDAIALWFGLFVVERLLERDRELREHPARTAAWRTTARLHTLLVQFIDYCVEHTWVVPDAPNMWRAMDAQDASALGPLLERMVIDAPSPNSSPSSSTGRGATELYLQPALIEADRLISRYVSVAAPEAIALAERLESLYWVQTILKHKGNVSHIGASCWQQLFEIERDLRACIELARNSQFSNDLEPPRRLLENGERWLRPGPGWAQVAIDAVSRPKATTPREDETH